ncbi:MAG: hypothetical protein ABSC46_14180 [Candidatus Limnocylindrales bacterium]
MPQSVASMLPFAIVLACLGAAIWFLLSREMALGVWLLAAFLVGHGLIHLLFFVPQPAAAAGAPEWPFDMARSWAVTGAGLDVGTVRVIGAALIAVVAVCFVAAGLATVGVIVPPNWWRAAVVASAAASIVLLALFFNPQLVLGLAIDSALLMVVVAAVWAPA